MNDGCNRHMIEHFDQERNAMIVREDGEPNELACAADPGGRMSLSYRSFRALDRCGSTERLHRHFCHRPNPRLPGPDWTSVAKGFGLAETARSLGSVENPFKTGVQPGMSSRFGKLLLDPSPNGLPHPADFLLNAGLLQLAKASKTGMYSGYATAMAASLRGFYQPFELQTQRNA